MWALGDYHRFAKETVWELGPVLVEACGISPGQRVLDVAAGTGNTAIRAAEAGAEVVASDLTPENFEAGRREAEAHGVELEWVEADAEALPFADGEFDVVTSSFGAIFAPDHQAVADEMLRVCRPGGTIGMLNFTPEGLISDFFGALAPYMPPPPPGALPPAAVGQRGARTGAVRRPGGVAGDDPQASTWSGRTARATTASSSSRRSGRWSLSTRASPRSPSARRRSTATSWSSPRARTEAPQGSGGVPLRVPARGRPEGDP